MAEISVALARALAEEDVASVLMAVRDQGGAFAYPLAANALRFAIMAESTELAVSLCAAGIDVNYYREDTILMSACHHGNVEIVRALLAKGADVTAANDIGQDATMVAAKYGHTALVRIFVEHGVRERKDNFGRTALHWAMTDRDVPDVCAFLLAHGWSPKAMSADGITPVDYATRLKRSASAAVLQ